MQTRHRAAADQGETGEGPDPTSMDLMARVANLCDTVAQRLVLADHGHQGQGPRPQVPVPLYTGYDDRKSVADFLAELAAYKLATGASDEYVLARVLPVAFQASAARWADCFQGQRADPQGNDRLGEGNFRAWCANLCLITRNKGGSARKDSEANGPIASSSGATKRLSTDSRQVQDGVPLCVSVSAEAVGARPGGPAHSEPADRRNSSTLDGPRREMSSTIDSPDETFRTRYYSFN
ncbi:hypothetical protein ISCGN_017665 [Ixodes scapularis]